MATKYLEAAAAFPGAVADAAGNVREIYIDTDNEIPKLYDKTNSVWRPVGQPYMVSLTASATLVLEDSTRPLVINAAAGVTLTLPTAVGSGAKFRIEVGTTITSASIVVNTPGSDKFYGGVFINDTGGSAAATADYYPAVAGSSVTLTLAQSDGAGKIGDYLEIVDVGALKWRVFGVLVGEIDPVTPWS